MVNTSATGGFLQPTSVAPLEGEKLEDFFHDLIVGCTGLNDQLVRPSWQPEPPNIPVKGSVLIAFHFVDKDSDAFPFVGQVQGGDDVQQSQLQNNEEFSVHCAIYGTGAGSQARAVAKLLRDNLMIPQNRETMASQGMSLVSVPTAPQPAPLLVKEIWQYRVDMEIPIRRLIVRDYDVKTIESAQVQLTADAESTKVEKTITVEDTIT